VHVIRFWGEIRTTEAQLKKSISIGHALGISLVLAVLTMFPSATFADSIQILFDNTCDTGSTCPGAPFIGSTEFTILFNDGIPQPLFDPITDQLDTVYAGDVLIYAGSILEDLLRFPSNGHGLSQEVILYERNEPCPGCIPPDRQPLVVSIEQTNIGDFTLYRALTGGHEIDYSIDTGSAQTPEPGTASLVGTAGLLLIIGLRFKEA